MVKHSNDQDNNISDSPGEYLDLNFCFLADHLPHMVFINVQGRIVYTNSRCEELTGYTKSEFFSKEFKFWNLIAPESLDLVKSRYREHQSGREIEPYEYTVITKSGRRIEVAMTTRLIDYGSEKGFWVLYPIYPNSNQWNALFLILRKLRGFC